MTKFMQYVIDKMLFETCGEDPDVIENAEITELAPYYYHITYKKDDPFDGIDLEVEISIEEDEEHPYDQSRYTARYIIYNSVYGDDGAFKITL